MESTIGMWKGRFTVLEGPLRHDPLKSAEIITATACIHNFAVSKGDMWVHRGKVYFVEPHNPLDYYGTHDIERQLDGKKVRAELVTNVFSKIVKDQSIHFNIKVVVTNIFTYLLHGWWIIQK